MTRCPVNRFAIAAISLFVVVSVSAAPKETVHLVISGGPNAGTYDATAEHGGCSAGLNGPGSWGNQLSQPKEKDPKKFNSLQLILPNAARPTEFFIAVGFGPLLHRSADYKVDTRPGKPAVGSGTVKVADRGATAVMTFDVATPAGVKLQGTIDCKSVLRAPK